MASEQRERVGAVCRGGGREKGGGTALWGRRKKKKGSPSAFKTSAPEFGPSLPLKRHK